MAEAERDRYAEALIEIEQAVILQVDLESPIGALARRVRALVQRTMSRRTG